MKAQWSAEHGNQGGLLSLLPKLLRHFKRHQPSEAIASEEVRTGGLHIANL